MSATNNNDNITNPQHPASADLPPLHPQQQQKQHSPMPATRNRSSLLMSRLAHFATTSNTPQSPLSLGVGGNRFPPHHNNSSSRGGAGGGGNSVLLDGSATFASEDANALLIENTSFAEGCTSRLLFATTPGGGETFAVTPRGGVSYTDAVRMDAFGQTNRQPSFANSIPNNASGLFQWKTPTTHHTAGGGDDDEDGRSPIPLTTPMTVDSAIGGSHHHHHATSLCVSAVDPKWMTECVDAQPFGVYLGTGLDLVPAYSNGAVEDISHGESYLPGTEIYCGMPWECLEYARRFLVAWYGITFASMDGANSLFNCDYFMYVENFERESVEEWTAPAVTVKREVNGEATAVPTVGSLLLYPVVFPAADMPFGHVAVVVERSGHHIRVAEQNWDNSKWAHHRYSRQLEVAVDEVTGKVTVLDEEPYTVLGWLDFSENERRAPKNWDTSFANDATRNGPSTPSVAEEEGAAPCIGEEGQQPLSTHEET